MREQKLLERVDALLLRPVILLETEPENYWHELELSFKEGNIWRATATVVGAFIHLPLKVAGAIYKAAIDHFGELPMSLSEIRRKAKSD